MSRLEELLQEYCPNGVKYIPIGEVTDYEQPSKYIVKSTDYNDDFEISVLTAGQSFVLGYTSETDGIYNASKENPVIIFDDFTGAFKWVDFPFKVKSSAMKMLKAKPEKTTLRYLFHVMGKIGFTSSEHKRLWISIYSTFEIPLPPLEVQSEIVRILDNFTELTARQKQYNYYRNKLLTFNGADIPIVQLRTVVKKSCSGSTPTKGNSGYYENGTIPWIRTQDVHFNEITEVDSYITEKAVAETAVKWIPENCVIVAISGATAGRCAINKIKATTNQHCLNLEIDESKALYRYIYYCIYNKYDELLSRKQGARGDLNSSLVLSLEIPIPALDVQRRLVYVLDNFDSICSDLKIGLPAEIEARQKQYEFYCDALLTYVATGKTMMLYK